MKIRHYKILHASDQLCLHHSTCNSKAMVASERDERPNPACLRTSAGPRRLRFFLAVPQVAILSLICAEGLSFSDWPRFRGPNGTGVSADTGLPSEIDRDKNVSWSAAIPKGNSSPIVVGGRVFLTAHEGDKRMLFCYNSMTGEPVWQRYVNKARAEVFHPRNGPTTPTPVSDGTSIFVFFPEFGLLAYDLNGRELWRTPLGPFAAIQGLAASPVYAEGRVILLVDTPEEAYLAAFNAGTGEPAWKKTRPTGVLGSYATPTLYFGRGGAAQVVVAGAAELTGYRVETGERMWWAKGLTVFPTAPPFIVVDALYTMEPVERAWPPFRTVLAQFDKDKDGKVAIAEASSDPIWARSLIGIDSNVGNRDGIVTEEEYSRSSEGTTSGGLARTKVGGTGDVSDSHVLWRHTKGIPALAGALLYQNLLYVVRSGIVSTFDPDTGKQLRQERIREAPGDYYASPVAGDGKVYLASLEGKITVLRSGTDWQVLSVGDLDEQVIATPAIADGCVYIRTEGRLYCFSTRKGK